ncbi:MAG: hypothetical protein A49_16220 [Methyloceanibacter sp.]|nr:MAG: hypothetical protein A49_16220 [Methyloceanibacter sp.]
MQHLVPLAELQQAVDRVGDYKLHVNDNATKETGSNTTHEADAPKESLYPLVLIVGYLLGIVLLFAWVHRDFSIASLMMHFMGGFFIVFSFFKFLDLRGFADAYRSYDILARAVPPWGLVYPFVELGLGVAYLAGWFPTATNVVTLIAMLVGAIGVLRALLRKSAIRCACLGTVLNLPMTKVTLVEDVGMAVMAALGLLVQ